MVQVIDIQRFLIDNYLSQRRFLNMIGYSEEYISKILNGKIETWLIALN